jgi:hypothetical protein
MSLNRLQSGEPGAPLLTRRSSRLLVLDGASPPPSGSLGSAATTKAVAPQAAMEVHDEVNHLRAQLEAVWVAMAKLEGEVVAAKASCAEAQAQLLSRCSILPSRGVLS